jgi:tRNA(Leu) C34 or U34 (ribose-2'-O)-methylase TrmL
MTRLNWKVKALEYTLYKEELSKAKNKYFNTIKKTKKEYWNTFLKKEDTQSIFKAISYTKDYSTNNIPSIINPNTKEYKSTF